MNFSPILLMLFIFSACSPEKKAIVKSVKKAVVARAQTDTGIGTNTSSAVTSSSGSLSQLEIVDFSFSAAKTNYEVGDNLAITVNLSAAIPDLSESASPVNSLYLSGYSAKLSFVMGTESRQAECAVASGNTSLLCNYIITKEDKGGSIAISSVEFSLGNEVFLFNPSKSLSSANTTFSVSIKSISDDLAATSASTDIATSSSTDVVSDFVTDSSELISVLNSAVYTVGDSVSIKPTLAEKVINVSIAPVLPDGLSINAGIISGVAKAPLDATSYTLTAKSIDGSSKSVNFTLSIFEKPSILVSASAYYTSGDSVSIKPTLGGGSSSVTIEPPLSNGLNLNTKTGEISGVATGTLPSTAYTLSARNSAGSLHTANINIGIFAAPVILVASALKYTVGETVSIPSIGGGSTSVGINPSLGNGLSLNTTTGVISGTVIGTLSPSVYTLTATNSAGASVNTDVTISIFAAPTLSLVASANYTTGDVVSITPSLGGGAISVSIVQV